MNKKYRKTIAALAKDLEAHPHGENAFLYDLHEITAGSLQTLGQGLGAAEIRRRHGEDMIDLAQPPADYLKDLNDAAHAIAAMVEFYTIRALKWIEPTEGDQDGTDAIT